MRFLEILRRCRHGTRRDVRVVRQIMREDAPHPAKPNNSDLHTHGERVGVDMPFGPIFSGVIFSHQAVCGPSRGAPWSATPRVLRDRGPKAYLRSRDGVLQGREGFGA